MLVEKTVIVELGESRPSLITLQYDILNIEQEIQT